MKILNKSRDLVTIEGDALLVLLIFLGESCYENQIIFDYFADAEACAHIMLSILRDEQLLFFNGVDA